MMGQSPDRPYQRVLIRIGGSAFYERAIQFHRVDGKMLQIAERRVASAKVINRHLYSQLSNLRQKFHCGFRVLHDRSFSQLQFKTGRVESGVVEDFHQALEKVPLLKMSGRNIYRNAQPAQPAVVPRAGLSACSAHYEGANIQYQAGIFGQPDKFAWREHTEFGMLPTNQRLEPHDFTRG